MEVQKTDLPQLLIIVPKVFHDARGFFLETFNVREFAAAGIPTNFVQDNHSRSKRGVLRGLHYQLEQPQGKVVSVIRGQAFDVAADVRRGSPTFGKWFGAVLDDVGRRSLWIPPGFAHGFCALSDEVDLVYKCTDYYNPRAEARILWNDPTLAIDWPISEPLVSKKDLDSPRLSEVGEVLPLFRNGS